MVFTWALALIVSVLLRVGGIRHPHPLEVNTLLIWALVFAPSSVIALFFWFKRHSSFDSANDLAKVELFIKNTKNLILLNFLVVNLEKKTLFFPKVYLLLLLSS